MNTVWTDGVDRLAPLPEYPRPQLVRARWMSLNGPWEYAVSDDKVIPESFDGTILVPFSPEAPLSGAEKKPAAGQYLWYRREVSLPEDFACRRTILHFGAVDQIADVWVIGQHGVSLVGG